MREREGVAATTQVCAHRKKHTVLKMATNPRKFSEKIALHNQKQAEETAAFEQIMKEVGSAKPVSPRVCIYVSTGFPPFFPVLLLPVCISPAITLQKWLVEIRGALDSSACPWLQL